VRENNLINMKPVQCGKHVAGNYCAEEQTIVVSFIRKAWEGRYWG